MTGKLVISFVQVISGSFSTINIDWPQRSEGLFTVLNVNPLNFLKSTYMCARNHADDPYLQGLLIYFLSPFAFLVLLFTVASVVTALATQKYVRKYEASEEGSTVSRTSCGARPSVPAATADLARQRVQWAAWNTCGKLYLWFCLIAYPSVSAR